jgi:alanine racemase
MGVAAEQIDEVGRILAASPGLKLEGIFTHFASADVPHTDSVDTQLEGFTTAVARLNARGLAPACIHSPNSAALLRFPVPDGHLVRPGIALYGCEPDPHQRFDESLLPVASLKAPVVRVRRIPAGTPVSYGGHFVAPRDTCIATVAAGYAHGVPRMLSNRGEVLIRGNRYRIAGNVTMDFVMVDCGDEAAIEAGDEAVVMGTQGKEAITADAIARQCGTIGYEILCGLSSRVERHYVSGGSVVLRRKAQLY